MFLLFIMINIQFKSNPLFESKITKGIVEELIVLSNLLILLLKLVEYMYVMYI